MIKARAKIISLVSGRSAVGGQVHGSSLPRTCPLTAAANGLPLIPATAERTRESGLYHYLHVLPEQPQELVWLTPQVGIDYAIEASTDLHWTIK